MSLQRYREQTTYVQKLTAELTEDEFQELQARFFIRQATECWNQMTADEQHSHRNDKDLFVMECAKDICTQGMYSSREVPTLIQTMIETNY